MIKQLLNNFGEERTNACLSLDNRLEFYIAENRVTAQSYIIPAFEEYIDVEKCLMVKNTRGENIFHISIDACFLTQQYGYLGKKCDFIVFSNYKFCFVELKLNAQSKNKKRVKENLREARIQLGATINYFDDAGVDFSGYNLEAYIVMKNKLYPTDQASIKERRKKFFDEFEIDLFEKSEIEF
jgi:hypothetical protein